MPLNKKYFVYYCRLSVIEGLNKDFSTSQLLLDKYNKRIYESCQHCHCVTEIKKGFKEDPFVCNMWLKLLQNQDKINPKYKLFGRK